MDADLRSIIERARAAVLRTKPENTRSAELHRLANALLGVAAEVQAAYQEQLDGKVNWRLSADDWQTISAIAQWIEYAALEWDWQQDPLIAQALRSGKPVEERRPNTDEMRPVEGMPARPRKPKCMRKTLENLPAGFPELSLSWSEMATEFLSTRRGARGGDDARGID